MFRRNHSDPQRIVVARYRYIGDTLLSIPFLRMLRRRHPEAVIHMLVGAPERELMADCPYIDEAIAFEPHTMGFWKAVLRIKEGNYDCAYLLKRSFSVALMMRLARVPERIGFDTDARGFLLTRRVPYRPLEQHEARCFLDLLQPKEGNADLTLGNWISDALVAKTKLHLPHTTGPRVILHAASTNPAKCWPLSSFAQLADLLISHYQANILFLGTAAEREAYDGLTAQLSPAHRANVTNLCGETTLKESMALLKAVNLLVGNDSGMIHMAAACNTPVVALFGPSDPRQWWPLSDKATVLGHPGTLTCQPCRMKITCDNKYPCLTEITAQQVFNACLPYLNPIPTS